MNTPEINILGGVAKYVRTEYEDANGKWNDNYNVSQGFYVIHEGTQHHVYYA